MIEKNEALEYQKPTNIAELRRILNVEVIKEYTRKKERLAEGLEKKDVKFK